MSSGNLYLITNVCTSKLALPVQHVLEIVSLPPISSVARGGRELRGVVNLRNRVLPVLDLRVVLGMPSQAEERERLAQALQQRAQDHINWINALEESLRSGKPFQLARDPHRCAFGKWYYSYKTTSRELEYKLRQIEHPHARIHALADELLTLTQAGKTDQAIAEVEKAKGGVLQSVLQLLQEIGATIREDTSNLAVIVENSDRDRHAAISIDSVDRIEEIEQEAMSPLDTAGACTDVTPQTARLSGDKGLALLVNPDFLTHMASRAAA